MKSSFLRTFISGVSVGAADIVPGISGGTVAFIIGIYEELLQAIGSINFHTLFRWKFEWQFLATFIFGVACSFITLAKGFQYCLNHEAYRPLLYSGFMGLVVGSVIFCARLLPAMTAKTFLCLVLGACSAYMLSGTELVPTQDGTPNDLFVIVCGALAISAMLLPGISGSYILNILGMYGPILGALVAFVDGIKAGVFDFAAFRIVACMVLGISLGALVFARVVRYLLANYHVATIATLVGFMVGALKCVWPFWTLAQDPVTGALKPLEPIAPDITSLLFLQSCLFFTLGIALVFFVEYLANKKCNHDAQGGSVKN